MSEASVPWGGERLRIVLPQHWKLQQVAQPELKAAGDDWPDHLAVTLNQPDSGLSLAKLLARRSAGRIVLIVEDVTRHSPLRQILEVILREIHHAGVTDEQLQIIFATGMHPPVTADQAAEKLGPVAETISWRCNPWTSAAEYVHLGRAGKIDVQIDRGVVEADLRIIISSVSPHLQAGFGGGYKMLLPGCASLETIRQLHRLGIGRSARQLVGTDPAVNPMRRAIDAGGKLVDAGQAGGNSFAVQYLLDADDQPTAIAAGEVLPTQQMLAKQCSVACGVFIESPADVLITNAYPRDFDLWQSFKGIANAQWAARPNGVVICLARCEAAMQGMDVPRWPLNPSWTRRAVRLLGAESLSSLIMRLLPHLAGDAAFFVRLGMQSLHRNPLFFVSPALHAAINESGRPFPGLTIFANVETALAAADAKLGGGPQRVIVFPAGGTTFPVPGPRTPSRPA